MTAASSHRAAQRMDNRGQRQQRGHGGEQAGQVADTREILQVGVQSRGDDGAQEARCFRLSSRVARRPNPTRSRSAASACALGKRIGDTVMAIGAGAP